MRKDICFETVAGGRELRFKEPLGNVVFSVIFYGIGYSFFFLAIVNLLFVRPLPLIAFLASVAWITIIVGLFVADCRKVGTAQHVANLRSQFVRNRFVDVSPVDPGEPVLCFGYRCGSRRHYFLKLRSKGIKSIDWNPGQGNVPEKDNDWNVALWFDIASIEFNGEGTSYGIYIVGPSGRKSGREALGSAFIEFLKANQIHLTVPPAELLGRAAEVVEPLNPLGKIKVGADDYVAHTIRGFLDKGTKVVIEEIRGTSIYARKLNGT